jgi:cell division protein FtsN
MTTPKRRIPRLPWFKDERVVGTGMSAAQTMRLFIVAVVLAVIVFALGAFYLISVSQKTDATARTAATTRMRHRQPGRRGRIGIPAEQQASGEAVPGLLPLPAV